MHVVTVADFRVVHVIHGVGVAVRDGLRERSGQWAARRDRHATCARDGFVKPGRGSNALHLGTP